MNHDAFAQNEPRDPNPQPWLAHVPVLYREVIEILNVRPDGFYIDATLGAGGHAEGILQRLESGKLLGMDRDPAALAVAQERLKSFGEKLIAMHGDFAQIDALHATSGLPLADGLLADLGMSSLKLKTLPEGLVSTRPARSTCAWTRPRAPGRQTL